MKAAGRIRGPYQEAEFALHRALTHILLLSDMLFASRIARVIGPSSQPVFLGTCAAIIIFYCAYLVLRGRILAPILAVFYLALMLNQFAVFADKLAIPANSNAIFQFIWILTFVPFLGISLALGRKYVVKTAVMYGTIYCSVYAAFAALNIVGALPGSILGSMISDYDSRGARIFLYSGLACLTYFYWLIAYASEKTIKNTIFLCICLAASLLSLSRVYIAITLVLTLAFLLRPHVRLIQAVALGVLLSGSAFVMSGMVFADFNPFSLFAQDTSGAYRALEYDVIRAELFKSPIVGFGISPSTETAKPFLGPYLIYPGDIGSVGVWFEYGLIGLCLYFIALWRCCIPQYSLPPNLGWPLFLTGCMLTANGWMSPLAISGGGSTITGLIFAIGMIGVMKRDRRSNDAAVGASPPAMGRGFSKTGISI